MGRTRSGNTYEPDKERPDDFFSCAVPSPPLISAIGHADNFFSCAVLSPPLIAHHVRPAQENTWSQVWEPEAKSRSILEVMAESLSRAGLDNNDTTTNGAARAACFLARLCTTSRAMRHMAGSCELWRSLLAMSFGPEYYAQTSLSLQTARGPFMEFEIYAQLTSELREYPSHFFRSIMLHRDGRARAQTFDLRAGALPFRELSISERSRVALWVPRFTLVDEGSFELSGISPRSLPKVSSMKASSLARLVQHAKPIRRQVTFHAPSGYAFCTVEVLLDAIRAFEAELAPEEHNQPRAVLAEFLPYGTTPDGEPPEFVLVWKEEDSKLPHDDPPSTPSLVMTPRIIEAAASVALPLVHGSGSGDAACTPVPVRTPVAVRTNAHLRF